MDFLFEQKVDFLSYCIKLSHQRLQQNYQYLKEFHAQLPKTT